MGGTTTPSTHLKSGIWLTLWLGIGAALSLKLKQDALWDTKNYHLYNAWAWLTGHGGNDIAAASMQSYFNPLPDLPYFLLATGPLDHWPRWLAMLQGLWFGALGYLIWRIGSRMAEMQGRHPGFACFIASLIGASGTMAVSQAGSTTNEIMLAWWVLLALYLLMPLFQREAPTNMPRSALLAGLCCGLAAGMKPTAVIYPPALCIALLFAPLAISKRMALAATLAIGSTIGFLAAYGWWGWHLYQLTGNPAFPMFNQLFHSDLLPPIGNTDASFKPRDITQWLLYPFFWLGNTARIVAEPRFSDPRYALAMLSVLSLPVSALLKRRHARRTESMPQHPVTRLIVAFVVISYLLWLVLFSILRYAIPIEALTGLLMLIAVQAALPRTQSEARFTKQSNLALVLLLVLTVVATRYPNWGRVPFGKHVFDVVPGEVQPGSLVLLGGIPSAYVAPFFTNAQQLDFIGSNWFVQSSRGYRLWSTIQQKIAAQSGPVYIVLRNGAEQPDLDLLHTWLPNHSATDCQPIPSNLEDPRGSSKLQLCSVTPDKSL